MKNIVKDIEINCEDKSVEGIVRFLTVNNDFPMTSNYYREIYFFYKEMRGQRYTHREARKTTIDLFNICNTTFKKVIRRFKGH